MMFLAETGSKASYSESRISSKVEEHAILLRHINQLTRLRMTEGQLSCGPKGDADGAVLIRRPLLIEGSLSYMSH